MIPEPLWSLMLSTNDCHPGCTCELDVFKIERARIQKWCSEHPEQYAVAHKQLDELIAKADLNHITISEQTNIELLDAEDAREWLMRWKVAMP